MITIRPIKPEDFRNGFVESLSSLSPVTADVETLTGLLQERKRCGHYTYVAVEEGVVVGTGSVFIEDKLSRDCWPAAHIEDVAVRPSHFGRGVGLRIVQHLIGVAREMECYKVILDCKSELVEFYEKAGFHEAGVCMRLDLES